MKNKKRLIAVFFVLFALATIGMIWVGMEAKKNLEPTVKPVAQLRIGQYLYQHHWLDGDSLCCTRAFRSHVASGADSLDRLVLFDTRSGKPDYLVDLNLWVQKQELASGNLLNFNSSFFSPDGKWLYAEEVIVTRKTNSESYAPSKQRWILSLTGKGRLPIISNRPGDRFEKWLPDSSGVALSNMKEQVRDRKALTGWRSGGKSQYCVKLENLNQRALLPDVNDDVHYNSAFSPDGKHRVGTRNQYLQIGNSTSSNEVVSAQLVIRNSTNDTLEFQIPKVFAPKHFVQSRQTYCLASPSGDRMLWVFEEDPLKRQGNTFLQRFQLPFLMQTESKIELIVTDRDGSNVHTQPMITSADFIEPREISWHPDGKRVSYMAGNRIYLVKLN